MKIEKETSFMRDELVKEPEVDAVVSPTYKKAIDDFKNRKELIKKNLKSKENREEPILGKEDDKISLEESLFEDYSEVINESKNINESYYENPVAIDEFNDLLDRAESNYDGDLEDAVRTAIDDGLIYTEDVLALMNRYMMASEISDVFYENCEDALFSELLEALEDKIGEREDEEDTDESLNESKDLDFVSDKFSQEMLSIVKDLLKDSSEEEALAKLDAKHEAGEIDDKKYEYIKNYFDTLKISAEESENRGEGEKRRDLWDIVYDEVFGSKSSVDNFYKSAEDAPKRGEVYYEESDKYFDPSEVVKGFNSKKYDGIGIKNAKDIDRLKKIAEKFNLKYSVGSSGKSIIIMVPAEMIDKSPVVYLKKLGLKQLKNLQK